MANHQSSVGSMHPLCSYWFLSGPHSCIEPCDHSCLLLWCLTGLSRLYWGWLTSSRWMRWHPYVDLLKSGSPDHHSGWVPFFSSWFICSSFLRPFSWMWASVITTGSCSGRLPWAVLDLPAICDQCCMSSSFFHIQLQDCSVSSLQPV